MSKDLSGRSADISEQKPREQPERLVSQVSDLDILLDDLRAIISTGRGRAAAAINSEMVGTYWQIGERIVREEQNGALRAAYGERALERLGQVLSTEFGRGFAVSSLRNMRQFYLTYSNRSAVRSELAWTHYRTLMRLPDSDQRDFYAKLAISGRWSSRELERQIGSMLYERAALSRRPDQLATELPAKGSALAPHDATFRDPYILNFLAYKTPIPNGTLRQRLSATLSGSCWSWGQTSALWVGSAGSR